MLNDTNLNIVITCNPVKNKMELESSKPYSFKTSGNVAYKLRLIPYILLTQWEPEVPDLADIHAGFYTMFV